MSVLEREDDYLVCLCKKRTKREIIEFLKENKTFDLNSLREAMDVGNKCGGCGEDLETLIEYVKNGGQ